MGTPEGSLELMLVVATMAATAALGLDAMWGGAESTRKTLQCTAKSPAERGLSRTCTPVRRDGR